MANKIKYNLKNVYYAKATIDSTTSVATYDTPVKWPGAVSISLSSQNSEANFYADGIKYFATFGNNGYSGDYECAMIPDSFRKDILGEVEDGKVLLETTDAVVKPFALLFEFDGDDSQVKHVLYNCTASRPSIESQTSQDSIDVKTEKISIKAMSIYNEKLGKNLVKAKCADSTAACYSTWTDAVYQPTT